MERISVSDGRLCGSVLKQKTNRGSQKQGPLRFEVAETGGLVLGSGLILNSCADQTELNFRLSGSREY